MICTCIARSAFIAHEWQKLHIYIAYMGQFLQDGENGQNVAFFWDLLWPKGLILTFLNCSEEILTGAF